MEDQDKELLASQTSNLVAMLEGSIDEAKTRLTAALGEAAHKHLLSLERRSVQRALVHAQASLAAKMQASANDDPDVALLALQINAMEAYDNALAYRYRAAVLQGLKEDT